MAALTVRSKLASMDVRMAIGTVRAHFAKDRVYMTLRASDLFVHPPQRIPGLIVVKLRMGADRFPARIGVAILTGNRNWAMRVCYFGLWTTYLRLIGICRLLQSANNTEGK